MWIKSQPIVGAILIVLCGTALDSCSQATQPVSSSPQSPPSFSPSSFNSEPLSPVSPPYSLAVLPFEDYSNRKDLHWLRQAIPEMLVTDLALLPGVRVVSRQRLGEVLKEQWLQQRGAFEESASVRLGRLVGARYLLSGLYYLVDGSLIVEGHLVDVERGSVARTVRVSGSLESIPSVELALAAKLGMVFSGTTKIDEEVKTERNNANPIDTDPVQSPVSLAEQHLDESSENERYPYWTNPSIALRTDTLLNMERLRDLRNAATTLADEIWKNAVTIQLGAPQYEPLSHDSSANAQLLKVMIPVVAQMQPEWFKRARQRVDVLEGKMVSKADTIVLAFQAPDAGAQQLFVEAMQSPRRLFVRAIGETGEVLGVSSQWSWRMDQHVQDRSDGTIELSVFPQVLLKGSTAFSRMLLVNYGAEIRFDAVIVSVPDEARVISIEPILEGEPHADKPGMWDLTWLPMLRTWLLQRWMPPVAESIPIGGYLPGNVRRSIAVLSGVGGTIHAGQVIQSDPEDGMESSIQEVMSQLPGQCFTHCDSPSLKKQPAPKPFQIRLQFELIKDIRFAGLNRKS